MLKLKSIFLVVFLCLFKLLPAQFIFSKESFLKTDGTPYFISPIDEGKYYISSEFGFRVVKFQGEADADIHKGIDLVAKKGTPIKSSADGVVVVHYPPPGGKWKGHPTYGGCIVIDHGGGLNTLYAHLSQTWVGGKQKVKQGQIIGVIGETGKASGVHLHFEICIDPLYVLKEGTRLSVLFFEDQKKTMEEAQKKLKYKEDMERANIVEDYYRFMKPWVKVKLIYRSFRDEYTGIIKLN
jgi:murein DD-endopeptidase MepM/ murein hydrolase activator NlpD